MKLSIIVCVLNEIKTIEKILQKINDVELPNNIQKEIIVIDNNSIDGTKEFLQKIQISENLKVFFQKKNFGKGNSIIKGIEESSGDLIIFQDADLEYDPKDYNKFIEVITRFEADAIIGSRLIYSEYTRSHNILNKFGNIFITLLFNILYNTTFTDIYSCYLCFKKKLLITDQLTTEGFEQHAEILCKVVKKGNKFYEVPISYNGRTQEEGKKIKFYHIFSIIFRIIIERLK